MGHTLHHNSTPKREQKLKYGEKEGDEPSRLKELAMNMLYLCVLNRAKYKIKVVRIKSFWHKIDTTVCFASVFVRWKHRLNTLGRCLWLGARKKDLGRLSRS